MTTNMHKRFKIALVNTANNLIEHGQITTRLALAKKVRPFLEKQITRAKEKSVHNFRILNSRLKNKLAVQKLINDVAPNTSNTGGYLSIIKCGFRYGDCAPMAIIKIISKNTLSKKTAGKK